MPLSVVLDTTIIIVNVQLTLFQCVAPQPWSS